MKKFIISILILTHSISYSQDTFSIVAVDPETGEVGAAGATCLFGQFGGIVDIISSIVPGKVNCAGAQRAGFGICVHAKLPTAAERPKITRYMLNGQKS